MGKEPYQCKHCDKGLCSKKYSSIPTDGKAFAEKRNLESHFITHTGDKPYSCSFYVQVFKKNDGLTKYLRIHNIVT